MKTIKQKIWLANRWWDDLDTIDPATRFLSFILAVMVIWLIPVVFILFGVTAQEINIIPIAILLPLGIIRILWLNHKLDKWKPNE